MRLIISIKCTINTINFRIVNVSIKRKTMTNSSITWKLSSKSINWELFVVIIILKYVQARMDSIGIPICSSLWMNIMKRRRFTVISIWQCKINGNMNSNFASTEDIVQESNSFFNFELGNNSFTTSWNCNCMRTSAINHIRKSKHTSS